MADMQTIQQMLEMMAAQTRQANELNQQLMDRLSLLDNQRGSSPAVSVTTDSRPKIPEPEHFHGNKPDKLNNWISQCRLAFRIRPESFSTEEYKVIWVVGYLRDAALRSVQLLLDADSEEVSTVENLFQYLRTTFGDPDERGTAQRKFDRLRQTGTAAEYFVKVRELIAVLGWPQDGPVLHRVQNGLDSRIKDEIARSDREFETVADLQNFVVKLDQRMRQRDEERGRENYYRPHQNAEVRTVPHSNPNVSVPSAPPPKGTNFGTGSNLVPISNPRPPLGHNANRGVPRPPISEAERKRRMDNDLCNRCGSSGHFASTCPGGRPPGAVPSFSSLPRSNSPNPGPRPSSPYQGDSRRSSAEFSSGDGKQANPKA